MTCAWWQYPIEGPDAAARAAAEERQAQLTKPPGSLGRLEQVAVCLAGLQGTPHPRLERVHMTVFAGDHGVVAEGVSAYPQVVTREMVRNFARGGAAISVLARELGASLDVVDAGVATPGEALPGVIAQPVAAGTANLSEGPAMTADQRDAALALGRDAVTRAEAAGAQAFVGGEMGIGNTTAAVALACALLDEAPHGLVGPGTGLDERGVAHKAEVIERALARNASARAPFDALAAFGGFEIAALSGACIAAAGRRMPVLVDGFIASVAALTAVRQVPAVADWLICTHRSAEPGHDRILRALEAQPLLDLGMRLGEGSGAAVAVPLLRTACALHNGMATFAEAGVSQE